MNRFAKTIILSALLPISVTCNAQQTKAPPATGGGMMMGTEEGAMDPVKMEAHLKEMQEHMLQMHDLSNKILAETDPQKQQALKDQQLELMKAQHSKMMSNHAEKPMDHKKMR